MVRKTIFITGAAAGIGRATAELFAGRGWFVGLYDVNAAGVEALREQIGADNAAAGRLDVTDPAAWAKTLSEFWEAGGGRLDLLFNCAGIVACNDFEEIPLDRHAAVIDVNFKGVVNGCHVALPYLRRTGGARVINMASASAIYGSPSFAVYSATKFAVRGLTEALNIEWHRHGIAVMDIMPLFVDTPMVAAFETHPKSMDVMGMHLKPADIAATVWRAAHRVRWLPRVHWLPGLQTWGTYLMQRLTPVWFNRLTTKAITGY